jgi:hypothetical protein
MSGKAAQNSLTERAQGRAQGTAFHSSPPKGPRTAIWTTRQTAWKQPKKDLFLPAVKSFVNLQATVIAHMVNQA